MVPLCPEGPLFLFSDPRSSELKWPQGLPIWEGISVEAGCQPPRQRSRDCAHRLLGEGCGWRGGMAQGIGSRQDTGQHQETGQS